MRNCELNFKLEEVLPKFKPGLQKKILHSVDLIRKAEKLALAYDPEDGYFSTFSGGKDSQCLYHIVKMAGVKHKTHMNLTSIDPPEVIRFVRTEYPDVELTKPKDSIFHIAIKKNVLPTQLIRWCCAEYKETAGAGKVTLIGIRHAESSRRAKRNEVEVSNRKYSGDLEGLDEYRKQRNSKHTTRKGTFSIINVNGKRELGCIHGKESLLISPIIEWTDDDVWMFLNTLGIKHCCLYDEGFKRIGCILCPMARRTRKEVEMKRWPHVKRNWIKAIKDMCRGGYTFGSYPKNFDSLSIYGWRLRLDGNGKEIAKATDVDGQRKDTPYAPFENLTEDQKNEIAENIFDWWISGESYKKWYFEKFMQQDMFKKND